MKMVMRFLATFAVAGLVACGTSTTGTDGSAGEAGADSTGTDSHPTDARPDVAPDVSADVALDVVTDAPADVVTDTGGCSPATPVRCGATCVNTMTDPTNCGSCGNACPGGSFCVSGACSSMCPSPMMTCGTACVDTSTNLANCGSCGHACATGQTCSGGVCSSMCTSPMTMCGALCVNTQTDINNCGTCSHACGAGNMCVAGACQPTCPSPMMVCGTACVNTQTDNANCGTCGNACASGTTCTGGTCTPICAAGQMLCSGTCVNTMTDNANCGTCGNACGAGTACMGGVCTPTCVSPMTMCGTACVNTQTDPANCGTCGTVCPGGQMCVAGVCSLMCTAPLTVCGTGAAMTCVNLQTDPMNCGACGTACAMGSICTAGACRPTNDDCPSAIPLTLSAAGSVTVMGSTVGATPSAAACTTTTNDVYYSITLTQTSIVYIDTFGSTYDTRVGFHTACGVAATACNDDSGCGGLQSRSVTILPAGTHAIEVGGFGAATGSFTLNVQVAPAASGTNTQITPGATMGNVMGTTSGTSTVGGSCGASTTSGENTYYFVSCPADPMHLFHATTCASSGGMASYDTVLYERNGGVAADTCNDDAAFACGVQSSITTTIPAGAGLHTITVDGFGGAVGTYTMEFREDMCTAGFTLCGATCLETTRFQTDNANCGGCGNVCAAGTTCNAGVCRPNNDTCAAAATLAYPAAGAQTTVTGTITNATTETTAPPRAGSTDIWWTFTIPAADGRQLVYLDTFGTGFDTVVYVEGACGTAPVASNDDSGCGGSDQLQSQFAVALNPGTYRVAVTPFGATATGNVTLHMQRLALPTGLTPAGTVPAGAFTLATNTVGAPSGTFSCVGASPQQFFTWMTCPAFASAALTATTCTNHPYDTALEVRDSNATAVTCNDDTGGTCGTGSTLNPTIPAGAALHAIVVGGFGGGSGTATLTGMRP